MASELKWCMVLGDLSADRAEDQYPTVPVCADCIAADESLGEDKRILSVNDVVKGTNEECFLCSHMVDDE